METNVKYQPDSHLGLQQTFNFNSFRPQIFNPVVIGFVFVLMTAKRPGDDSVGGEFKKPRVEVL